MGIMVRVPVSVLIMASAPGDSGASRRGASTQTAPHSEERGSAQPCLDAFDQTSKHFDRIQKFNVQMDLASRRSQGA